MVGVHCCTQAFSSCSKQGLLSSCGAWASHCGGFSCCEAWALGLWESVVAVHGFSSCGNKLSCSLAHGIFWTKDWTHIPCIARQILNHWTIRETLNFYFLNWDIIAILISGVHDSVFACIAKWSQQLIFIIYTVIKFFSCYKNFLRKILFIIYFGCTRS